MANAAKGEASVETAAGVLTLAYNFGALCEVEDAAGKSIGDVLLEISQGSPRLKTARALIYGGLREHHPDIDLSGVGELLLSDGAALTGAMEKALTAAFPQAKGTQPANPRKPRRGTGSRS